MNIRTDMPDIKKLTIKGNEEELRLFALTCLEAIDNGMSKGYIHRAEPNEIRIKFVNTQWDP